MNITPSVSFTHDKSHPWAAHPPDGASIDCEDLATARAMAGCKQIEPPGNPVKSDWFATYLRELGISAPALSQLLGIDDDRRMRRWKAGDGAPPFYMAELLASWADGRPPRL